MIRKKTASEIVGDIIALIQDSELAASVSGEIYREGSRPRDSRAEDISVIFTHPKAIPNFLTRRRTCHSISPG